MIDHVSISVRDLKAAARFYEAVLGAIGYARLRNRPATVGFGKRYPEFWLNHRPGMPEIPDLTVYLDFLQNTIVGETLEHVRLASPFVLRTADPPKSYEEISQLLGMPIGSIGPTLRRSLDRLRETSAMRAYLATPTADEGKGGGQHVLARVD